MSDKLNPSLPTEVQWAELNGMTRASWVQLPRRKQERILTDLKFVKRWDGAQIFFDAPYPVDFVTSRLKQFLESLIGSADVTFFSSAALTARRAAERFEAVILDPNKFHALSFGADVAERDTDLLEYFISTKAFERASSGAASVIIGPKGSGKTAILKALQSKWGEQNTIVITPEVFATSMLRQVVEGHEGVWEEDQAFTSTWIFTILVEVFKRLSANPKGVPANTLKKLRTFLRDNANYQELDLFTRFIGYLRRIEGVKVGPYELTVKTRLLQELYSLSSLYEIVPSLRGAGGEIFILLDELDQGWDNSRHANRFVASLLQAAIKIQSLGLKAHVVAFLRSEIFDLIKDQLDQLDKLRSSIEIIKWSDGEFADLIVKRIAHSLAFSHSRTGHEIAIVSALFDGNFQGMNGFFYVLSRTSFRPREILQFVSHAHRLAVEAGQTPISTDTVFKAEEDFSFWKLEHICSEYAHIYPKLKELLGTFRAEGPVMSEVDTLSVIDRYTSQVGDARPSWACISPQEILQILYDIEFVGIPRPQPAKNRSGIVAQYEFAYERRAANLRSVSSFLVHPAFWSALEIPVT
jgi:hypothetical protein